MLQRFHQFVLSDGRFVVLAAVVVACLSSSGALRAGTSGDPQIFNAPEGRFAQPGAPGLCQCNSVIKVRALSCPSSAAECQALCKSRIFAFVPDAGQSCPGSLPPAQPTS